MPYPQVAMRIALTSVAGVGACGFWPSPTPFADAPAIGLLPFGGFATAPISNNVYSVNWTGTTWRATVTLNFSSLSTSSGNLVWNAANGWFAGSVLVLCPGFPAGNKLLALRFTPEAYMSYALLRNYVDEEDVAGGELWRWSLPFTPLIGCKAWRSYRGSDLWNPDHPRGDVKEVGTSALPRAGGQRLRFLY